MFLGTQEQLNVDVDGEGRWQADMLNKEQIKKNCENMRTQGAPLPPGRSSILSTKF